MVEMWQQPQPGPQQARPGELPEGVTLTGYVKVFRQEKGFGFISADCGGPDVFVHKNQLQGGSWLQEGMQVAFQCRMNPLRGKFEVTTCSGPLAAHQGGQHPPVQNDRPAAGPSDNLFVADLPPGFSEEQIKEVFGQYGVVRQVKVLANQPNHSRVAALVRFADINQARWVVENLDGNIPLGLSASIKVRFAGVRPGDRFSGGCCGGGKGGAHLFDQLSLQCAQGNGGGCGCCGGGSVPIGGDRKVASAGTFAAALGALLPMVSQHSQALQGIRALQQSGAGAHLASTIGSVGSNAAAAALGIDLAAVSAAAVTVAAATQTGNQAPVAATAATTSGTTVCATPAVATSPVAASATSSWIQGADPSTGRMYYFNSGTGESRWDRPPEFGGEVPS